MAIPSILKVRTIIRIVLGTLGDVPYSGHLQNHVPTGTIGIKSIVLSKYSPFLFLAIPVFGNISCRFWQHKKKCFQNRLFDFMFLQGSAREFFIMNKLCPDRPVAVSRCPGEVAFLQNGRSHIKMGIKLHGFSRRCCR